MPESIPKRGYGDGVHIMKLITIENKGWGYTVIHEGKAKGSRLEFKAGQKLEVYLKGPSTDCYEVMQIKAVQYAMSIGIAPMDLKTVSKAGNPNKVTRQKERLL